MDALTIASHSSRLVRAGSFFVASFSFFSFLRMSRKSSAAATGGEDGAPTFQVKGYEFGSAPLTPMRSDATKPFVVLVLASNEVS